MIEMTLLLTISAILRSFTEIRNNRLSLALPFVRDLMSIKSKFNLDPYHTFSNAHWMLTRASGALFVAHVLSCESLSDSLYILSESLVWFWHGLIFDIFYHVVLIEPGKRDPEAIWIVAVARELCRLIRKK